MLPIGGGGSSDTISSEALGQLQQPHVIKRDYEPLDQFIFSKMSRVGARAAQLAVARGGKLVIARTYTYAEENYPVAHNTHLFRTASSSKALTGMAVVAHFAPNGLLSELEPPIGQSLSLTNPNPLIVAIWPSIAQVLAHNGGFPVDYDGDLVAAAGGHAPPPENAGLYGYAQPGDTTEYLQQETDITKVFAYAPGFAASYGDSYCGVGPQIMSEAISWKRSGQRDKYTEQMKIWWFGDAMSPRAAPYVPSISDSINKFDFVPVHASIPDVIKTVVNGEPGLHPVCYGGSGDFPRGAAAWVMSSGTVVELLSRMDPSSQLPQLLTAQQVELIRTDLYSADTGFSGFFLAGGSNPNRLQLLLHAGDGAGAASVLRLTFRAPKPHSQEMEPSTAVSLMYDTQFAFGDAGSDDAVESIESFVKQLEEAGPWGEDLFDELA